MEKHLTTIKQETWDVREVNINEIKKILIEKFNNSFDAEHRSLTAEELKIMEELNRKYKTERWIEMKDYMLSKSRNGIKVAEGTYIREIKYGNENTAIMVQDSVIVDSSKSWLIGKSLDELKLKI